jgi:hypothetical protein
MTPAPGAERTGSKNLGRLIGVQEHSGERLSAGRGAKAASVRSKPSLDQEASAALRERLVAELKDVKSAEEAASWAHRILGDKYALSAGDAAWIEDAFRAKLAMFATDTASGPQVPQEMKRPETQNRSDRGKKRQRSAIVDKSVLALPEPRRVRDREHVIYVTQESCLICGRRPSDAHHLRFAQSRAKASDEFTVPLCRGHHREVHRSGDEATWWKKAGINPTLHARMLWLQTHPLRTNLDNTEAG